MSNVTNTAKNTVNTLLGTVSTAANVTTALLNSTNIVALDLQARTQKWADQARIDREVDTLNYLDIAVENQAIAIVTRLEERQTWFNQNPNRQAAFDAALAQTKQRLAASKS